MNNLKSSIWMVMLLGVLIITLENISIAQASDANDPNVILVQQAKHQFEQRYSNWQQYIEENGIVTSSVSIDYMNNEPFRNLVKMGPVAVPWFIEKGPSVFMNTAINLVLRTDWAALAGITEEQQKNENMYIAFDAWWKTASETMPPKVETRFGSFRTWLNKNKTQNFNQVKSNKEFKELTQLGLFGLPTIIERIKSGISDEYDIRLLLLWIDPVEFGEAGFPKRPSIPEVIPEAKAYPEYWLTWWKNNSWQFWWL
jgi:hypothetical protein